MRVCCLADVPEHLKTVTSWVYEQWGHHMDGLCQGELQTIYAQRMQHDEIPLCLVAELENTPVGTASIVHDDMPIRPQYKPWMASVYVAPEQRMKGIGSSLVRAIEARASELGIKALYLYTPDRESFYARLGWQVVERLEYQEELVVVMRKWLD